MMIMKHSLFRFWPLLMLPISGMVMGSGAHNHFGTIASESRRLARTLPCQGHLSVVQGMPDFWGCMTGPAQTVKVSVNESEIHKGQTESIHMMWNDWTKDIGFGLHADQSLALKWTTAVVRIYAPNQVGAVVAAFKGKANQKFVTPDYLLTYTYEQGPGIGTHLVVITSK
jgi:hypothetical protein